MNNTLRILALSAIGFLIGSCHQVEYVSANKLPKDEPKLVVSALVSPQDSLIKAYIALSIPVFGEKAEASAVTDAEVIISDGTKTKTLTYDIKSEDYFSLNNNFIQPGKTYTLQVKYKNYICSSKTTVPEAIIPFILAKYKEEHLNGNFGQGSYRHEMETEVTWNDQLGKPNYYQLRMSLVFIEETHHKDSISLTKQEEHVFPTDHHMIYTDEGKKNTQFKIRHKNQHYSSSNVQSQRIYVELKNINQDYYKYLKSEENYDDENPFIEPYKLYSNIEGGLGIFSSSNNSLKVYPIKEGKIVGGI